MQVKYMKKLVALTMAELVLVLSIIGTIAAVTIPGLKKYSQRTELADMAQKAYFVLEEMVDNAILTEGPIRTWDFSSEGVFFDTYMKKNIRYSGISASTYELATLGGAIYKLNDCDATYCEIEVDVNGKKSPNLAGKDKFLFIITKSGEDTYYRPETVQPKKGTVSALLREHDWTFSQNLWDCEPANAIVDGGCSY